MAKGIKGCRHLTEEEVSFLLGRLDGRDRLLALVCLYTGARISEALALDVADVATWRDGAWRPVKTVTFRRATTKGRLNGRAIPVHAELSKALADQLVSREANEGREPVFTGRTGRLSRTGAWRAVRAALDELPHPERTGTHSLRKTFVQRLYVAGTSVPVMQDLLGHADVRDTMAYVTTNEAEAVNAVSSLPPVPTTTKGVTP